MLKIFIIQRLFHMRYIKIQKHVVHKIFNCGIFSYFEIRLLRLVILCYIRLRFEFLALFLHDYILYFKINSFFSSDKPQKRLALAIRCSLNRFRK